MINTARPLDLVKRMKIPATSPIIAAAVLLFCTPGGRAAEPVSTNTPAAPKISREQLREEIKNLTPEERAARLKQWREQNATGLVEESIRRRELLKGLTPAEREAKLKEWRERGATNTASLRTPPPKLTPEQREAKRMEIRQRVESEYAKLRQKEADGSISDEERIRLRRVEAIRKRLPSDATAAPAKPDGAEMKSVGSPTAPGTAK
jgi:hypothetical protein